MACNRTGEVAWYSAAEQLPQLGTTVRPAAHPKNMLHDLLYRVLSNLRAKGRTAVVVLSAVPSLPSYPGSDVLGCIPALYSSNLRKVDSPPIEFDLLQLLAQCIDSPEGWFPGDPFLWASHKRPFLTTLL